MDSSDEPTFARSASAPIEFGGDALIWATWLYYSESLTQNDIAQALGVSRASVANYLAEARRRGLVQITLAQDLLGAVSQSRALAACCGLEGAFITPNDSSALTNADAPGDDAGVAGQISLRRRLGVAAAHALAPRLAAPFTLGVAWGRTMLELARAMPERTLPSMQVLQVSGSSLGEADSSPEACTALMASRLNARCQNLYAPGVVSSPALRDALMAEPTLKRHFERLRACDAVVYGVGEVADDVVWSDPDMLPHTALGEYREHGAVGLLISRFIDTSGREVAGSLSNRQIGMTLEELRQVPTRICVAGGAPKFDAIRATLAGGYVTHLVTDAQTAQRLLEDPP